MCTRVRLNGFLGKYRRNLRGPGAEKNTRRIERGGALLLAAALVLIGCSWVTPVSAQTTTIDANLTFAATGQNQWGNGDPLGFTSSGAQTLGVGPLSFDVSTSFPSDGIYHDPLGISSWGAFLGVKADANVGINYNINATAGTLNLTYPVEVGFTVPTPSTTQVGALFAITFDTVTPLKSYSFLDVLNGTAPPATIAPRLTTAGPQIGAYAEAYLSANLHAGAEVCAGACIGPAITKGIPPTTQELLAMNMNSLNGDQLGVLRVLGKDIPGTPTPTSVNTNTGALQLSAQIPTLKSDSSAPGGGINNSTGVITATDSSPLLGLSLDVAQLASTALGLPDLSGKVAGIGYNLLTANAGLGVTVNQSFTFDPNLSATLNFGSNVDVRNPDGTFTSKSNVTFTLGQTVYLKAPNTLTLQATPTYDLHNSTINNTSLNLWGDVNVNGLGANIAGLEIGPLIPNTNEHVNLANIPLTDTPFEAKVAPLFGDPFNILFNPLDTIGHNICADFPTACANNTGLVGVSHLLPLSGYYQDTIYQVPGYTHLPLGWSSWEAYFSSLDGEPPYSVFGQSDPYLFDQNTGEKVFFDNLGDILANAGESVFASNTDLTAADVLDHTGFVNEAPAFLIPEGDPFPSNVPEPSTILLLVCGLACLAGMRRKLSA